MSVPPHPAPKPTTTAVHCRHRHRWVALGHRHRWVALGLAGMLLFDGVCKYLKEWSKWRVNLVPQEEECDGGQYFNKVPLPAGHDVTA